MSRQNVAPDISLIAAMRAPAGPPFAIVLKPLSRPELGDIRIDKNLFAVGRGEVPFVSYGADAVAELSRRHARIFSEHGGVYLADLGSKNGTTINGVRVKQKIAPLHDGDELCFGRTLSYQVRIEGALLAPPQTIGSVTLSPERQDLGLQALVMTQFPFLISKTDPEFAQYRDAFPHQVNYLSRRHAHIFMNGGVPFIEDLGSTNGTFVNGKRLNEQAVALEDGATVGFGGHHFVYKVSLQRLVAEVDPTVTQFAQPAAAGALGASEDKTTFIASASSFLDIFCVEQAPQQADELNAEVAAPGQAPASGSANVQEMGRIEALLSALSGAAGGTGRIASVRAARWALAAVAVLAAIAGAMFFNSGAERTVRDMLASGDAMHAASLASEQLQRAPDDTAARALATEAVLKAVVPGWMRTIQARQFVQAAAKLADMRRLSAANPDLQAIVRELDWITAVERFVAARGGADRPIGDRADADQVSQILKRWNDDAPGQQRAFATVSATVPEFKDTYAHALSHVRKLALLRAGRHGEE
jgi:pSer/pThr/pTyr-binding forkhead associated (FHA) protein